MDYISFVDISNKQKFDLGKRNSAKYYLPYLAYKSKDNQVLIFGDETHSFLEDQYAMGYEECPIEDENINNEILRGIEMSKAEFDEIFERIGGKQITGIEDYIRYKYRPN